MSITRSYLESELIDRVGVFLAAAGKDATTINGSNPSLNGPIRSAMGSLSYAVATPSSVTDTDLSVVPDSQLNRLLDFAELRCLENCMNAMILVDQSAGQNEQKLSQLRDQIQQRIETIEDRIRKPYGSNVRPTQCDTIVAGRAIPNDPNNLTCYPWSPPWRG